MIQNQQQQEHIAALREREHILNKKEKETMARKREYQTQSTKQREMEKKEFMMQKFQEDERKVALMQSMREQEMSIMKQEKEPLNLFVTSIYSWKDYISNICNIFLIN